MRTSLIRTRSLRCSLSGSLTSAHARSIENETQELLESVLEQNMQVPVAPLEASHDLSSFRVDGVMPRLLAGMLVRWDKMKKGSFHRSADFVFSNPAASHEPDAPLGASKTKLSGVKDSFGRGPLSWKNAMVCTISRPGIEEEGFRGFYVVIIIAYEAIGW